MFFFFTVLPSLAANTLKHDLCPELISILCGILSQCNGVRGMEDFCVEASSMAIPPSNTRQFHFIRFFAQRITICKKYIIINLEIINAEAVECTNTKTIISGGSYAVPVDPEYLDESLKYELHSTETNSDAPYSYYPSTEEALQNAKPGDTISDVTQEPSAETYTVTLQYRDGVTADTVYADQPAGHLLVLPSPTRAGYTFLGWYDGSQTVSSPYPVSATVTLTAQWKEDAKPDDGKDDDSSSSSDGDNSYTISIPSKTTGGTVTVSPRYAEKGDSVTLTVKPDEGYVLETLTVTDTNGNTMKLEKQIGSRYTFTMPDMRVTVQASFAADSAASSPVFSDVPDGYWAEDAILWAYENGYMNGDTASTFNPGDTVTRQQLWMILARLNGQSPADFAAARDWAVESGLSDGTAPGSPVSRQQLVTMLWRQAGNPAATAVLTSYPDAASVADYAVGALSWAVENGFVSGTASATLNPGGTATRAQFAVILQRYCTAAQ
ncbi:Listeria/Bacterioides repeat-containing protein [Oscillibacter sp. PC13]|nr:Listeria/Bacterioides repeat-containing protein [Oscillibacter sp. PC13]